MDCVLCWSEVCSRPFRIQPLSLLPAGGHLVVFWVLLDLHFTLHFACTTLDRIHALTTLLEIVIYMFHHFLCIGQCGLNKFVLI